LAFALLRLAEVTEDVDQSKALYEEGLALSRQLNDPFQIAEGLQGLGWLLMKLGKFAEAQTAIEEDLALRLELCDQDGAGTALDQLGLLALLQGDYARARRFYEESLACYQSVNNLRYISSVIFNLANLAFLREDYAEAVRLCEQVLALSRESDYRSLTSNVLVFQGILAFSQGDYELAKRMGQEALLAGQDMGDNQLLASSYFLLGRIALSQGNLHEAEANISILEKIPRSSFLDPLNLSYVLGTLAMLSRRKGQLERAVVLFSMVEHLRAGLKHLVPRMEDRECQANLDALHQEMSAEAFTAAWDKGQTLEMNQTLAYALEGYLGDS
jgi:tetratricopeptide (TPR) repeat protein